MAHTLTQPTLEHAHSHAAESAAHGCHNGKKKNLQACKHGFCFCTAAAVKHTAFEGRSDTPSRQWCTAATRKNVLCFFPPPNISGVFHGPTVVLAGFGWAESHPATTCQFHATFELPEHASRSPAGTYTRTINSSAHAPPPMMRCPARPRAREKDPRPEQKSSVFRKIKRPFCTYVSIFHTWYYTA